MELRYDTMYFSVLFRQFNRQRRLRICNAANYWSLKGPSRTCFVNLCRFQVSRYLQIEEHTTEEQKRNQLLNSFASFGLKPACALFSLHILCAKMLKIENMWLMRSLFEEIIQGSPGSPSILNLILSRGVTADMNLWILEKPGSTSVLQLTIQDKNTRGLVGRKKKVRLVISFSR